MLLKWLYCLSIVSLCQSLVCAAAPAMVCDAEQGLLLLNQTNPPILQIRQLLSVCDETMPDATKTLLLHGLLARYEAIHDKHFDGAIQWFLKAMNSAAPDDFTPALELAVTFEWAGAPQNAALIYQGILAKAPQNRVALLGEARMFRIQSKTQEAAMIYEHLLEVNASDIDALNGLGWVKLSDNKGLEAAPYFEKTLILSPQNKEALLGLKTIEILKQQIEAVKQRIKTILQPVKPPVLCNADNGLILLNKNNPPLAEIKQILSVCDKNTPHATTALLLHGLLARFEAKDSKHYEMTISWLKKAMATAAPNDLTPALELAITEEWAGEPQKALVIYQSILSKHPHNRDALLGIARVDRMEFRLHDSVVIYQQLLKENPKDVDALNGLGWSEMANFELGSSQHSFKEALRAEPNNIESITAMKKLKTVTKYILALTGGRYTVPPEASTGTDVYFYNNINATDSLTVFATHNSKQIGAEFFTTPTLLPNNSVLVGYQYNLPKKYGWGVGYDYRQHNHLPLENRILGSANYYITSAFQWFGGGRLGTPSPWINQLYYSGLTLFTTLPANVTATGFWAHDEFGGPSSAYSIDLSKQFDDHRFYDIGTAYSPTLKNWELHGRIIWPTFENQAFVADFSHYYFNNSTFINAGWRIYW